MNLHIARFDEDDKFIGWDALESMNSAVPAGVPVCATFQFFVLNSRGDDKGNKLAWKAKSPYWIYAEDYQISASDLHLVHSGWGAIEKEWPQLRKLLTEVKKSFTDPDGPRKETSVSALTPMMSADTATWMDTSLVTLIRKSAK